MEPTQTANPQHAMWNTVAPAWGEHADVVDERSEATTARLLARAALRPGEHVLELACGPGGLGIAAAEQVGPGGHVLLSDVAPEMAAIAAERAAARGLANVSTAVIDFEVIDAADDAFDAVLIREGLMFAAEPAQALAEIRRVLRPGGRVAVAVWAARERNPWLGIVLDSVSEQLGAPVPPPGVPSPFSLSDPGRLADLFAGAGFQDVVVSEAEVAMGAPSFDVWWERTTALAGPLSMLLGSLPADAAEAIRAKARDRSAPYAKGDGLELPGVTLIASARA